MLLRYCLALNRRGRAVGMLMTNVAQLERLGSLGFGRKVLDFGSSNLYSATAEEIAAFVKRHNPNPRDDLEAWADHLAAGAKPGLNQSFIGEMFEAAGMSYAAIDIADGYKTTIVDLNKERLPARMVGQYDLVLNFGTSEHILNQMNVFAAVHAATKVGGSIMHLVPSVGWVDYGYFCYTSRFFCDLAGFNQYEIQDMWFEGPLYGENVFDTARQYQTYFPALTERLALIGKEEAETIQSKTAIPMISLVVAYRKPKDLPFMGTVETSTSVGTVPDAVTVSYQQDG
jgi:hypothetical protein